MPYKYPCNCAVYTGTHDNDTITGWYGSLCEKDKKTAELYLQNAHRPVEEIRWDYICCALSSVADTCIIPAQDYLGLDSRARINTPAVPSGNWQWRMEKGAFTETLQKKMRSLAEVYGRC